MGYPQHLSTTDTIVKKPEPKEPKDRIPQQYKSNKVSEDTNKTSIVEEIANMESLREAYVEMVHNFSDTYFINNVTCRAHLNYIVRLSKFNKKTSIYCRLWCRYTRFWNGMDPTFCTRTTY